MWRLAFDNSHKQQTRSLIRRRRCPGRTGARHSSNVSLFKMTGMASQRTSRTHEWYSLKLGEELQKPHELMCFKPKYRRITPTEGGVGLPRL